MFSYLPSVLSTWQLPGLAASALSSALQRRILFYLLKRTLGHLIKDNDLKLDQIDATSFGGKLEVRGVHLDAEAVTTLLPAADFCLESGLMGSITVQLPWPQILTGDLVITISDLDICLLMDASGHTRQNASSLAESLSSVAEEAMHENFEGIQLEESIQASIIQETDTADNVDIPTSGYIASVVEGLLTRLKISVNNLCIRLRHDSPSSPELQLRMDAIRASTLVGVAAIDTAQEITRTASIEGISIYLCGSIDDSTNFSQDAADEDSESEADYMAMSHAISDLRSSQIGFQSFHSAASADQSVYASAVGGEGQASRFFQAPPEISSQPSKLSENTEELVFKIVGEPTLVQFIMTRQLPAREEDEISNNQIERPSINLSLRIDLNNLVSFVTPASTCALLRFSEDCIASIRTSKEQQVAPISQTKARQSSTLIPTLETSINIKGVDVVCAYDNPADLDMAHYENFVQSLQGYWSRPIRIHPGVGHLRLRLQQIHCMLSTSVRDSSATLEVGDAALYEHLSPLLTEGDANITATLPLLLFDPHLTEQYSSSDKSHTNGTGPKLRPEAKVNDIIIESLDWRTSGPSIDSASHQHAKVGPYWKSGYGDRGWKLRPKNRRTSSTSVPVQESKTILTAKVDGKSNTQVLLSPLHLFVDISTVDRILPLLESLGKSTRADLAGSVQTSLAASFETLHQASIQDIGQRKKSPLLTLGCDLIRVEVRVPSSAPQPQLRGQVARRKRLLGLQVRAGIILVDARNVQLRLGSDENSILKTRVQFNPLDGPSRKPSNWPTRQEETAVCSLDQVSFFYKMIEEQRATNFAILGMLSSDDDNLEESLPPRLQLLREVQDNVEESRSFVDCRLPLLNVQLSKTLLDGLELLADDFSLWSSSLGQEPNEDHSESATDALKILGSRFFGTKHSISGLSGSSASMDMSNRSNAIPAFSLGINEIYISLLIPRKQQSMEENRRLSLTASEVRLFVDSKHKPRSTLIDVTVLSISVDDETEVERPLNIISRTVEQSLSRGVLPMVSTQLLSTSDADVTFRESRCDVLLQGFTLTFQGDLSLLDDLFIFTRSPDGAFEHVEPNEVTRFSLRMRDISLLVAPTSCKARAVVLLSEMALRTKLTPDAYQTTIRVSLRDCLGLVTEEKQEDEQVSKSRARTSQEYWSNAAFVKFVLISDVAGSLILSSLTRPEVDVKVVKVNMEVLACADTLKIVEDLSSHLTPVVETLKSRSRSSSADEEDDRDLLASLDQDAFRRAKPVASFPDLLEDDLPRHPDFLKSDAPWNQGKDEPITLEEELFLGQESTASLSTTTTTGQGENDVILQNEVVTIRLMDTNGIAPNINHFTKAQLGNEGTTTFRPGLSPSLRVRVQGCDVILRLFAGYDCQTTRTAVEEEARRVRRRLQKIKQMLDQGQMPDDSVEEATVSLLDSIHISLPQGQAAGGMEAADMIQAMDDELGDQSETASSASTWKQFIPGRSGPILSQQQRRKRSKLMRSKKSLIDVEAMGITVEYDQFSPKETLASRLLFQSKSLQILDNIKTSTWHTFLTEMAPEHFKLPRNAKDMIKVELVHVRPSQEVESEVRCRARISPIRLHVDQDALDFLKKFAAFRPPNALPDPPKPSKMEPFIQHAEVYPIKLKLDYKPKRVDYNLLREGKTIELMNFFNFEGSEMTLRHVTIRGISGWTRFFDTLQDIWTPDVKSNQLADVLSGISPIRSLVNVGNGVADLVLLPLEQYQRDGRLGKGLKAGAKSFVKSTMLEAARIGARLATGTQVILEQAETALAGSGSGVVISSNTQRGALHEFQQDDEGHSIESEEKNNSAQISRYANQPDNLMQALSEAQQGLSRGLNEAAQTILAVPMEVYERRGGEGGSRPVIRAVPIAVLKGAAGASGAVGKTLQGFQRELAGASREAEEDKYKRV